MRTKAFLFIICCFLLVAGQSFAQDGYAIGDEATGFNLLSTTGDMVNTENLEEAKGFIVVFTCNHCPYAKKYEDRINALNEKYADLGYPVIAINPNDPVAYPSDSYEAMIERAEEKGFTFSYVVDKTQEIARAYGATKTPHTFVLEKVDDKLIVRYIGAIDNSTNADNISTKYVEDAVDALISGEEIGIKTSKAIGCGIKWKDS